MGSLDCGIEAPFMKETSFIFGTFGPKSLERRKNLHPWRQVDGAGCPGTKWYPMPTNRGFLLDNIGSGLSIVGCNNESKLTY
jgi:hypothetical protein